MWPPNVAISSELCVLEVKASSLVSSLCRIQDMLPFSLSSSKHLRATRPVAAVARCAPRR